ncbi:hypothetical protein [Kitasatospora aureofaciens]|uniref:hypothetical protein n=1 Tax=Kitasatospora aureofaciens TaxID=1894 RepID=UPI0033D971E7
MPVEVRINVAAISRSLRARGGPAERALRDRTERVASIARREAPGTMPRFIESRIEATSAGLQGVVTSTHPATRFVLDGTRPHIIRPRRAKALRFEIGARVVFARLVHHPGTRPNNFLVRALREGR